MNYRSIAICIFLFPSPGTTQNDDSNLIARPSSEACNVGPIEKVFGDTVWNVYSCGDSETLAILATDGSPAMPFYFMTFVENGQRRLIGEGTGSRDATSAAVRDLRVLVESEAAISELIAQTIEAESRNK